MTYLTDLIVCCMTIPNSLCKSESDKAAKAKANKGAFKCTKQVRYNFKE